MNIGGDAGVDAVVNYVPPRNTVHYMHRAGRTARRGNCGTVVTIVADDEEVRT